MEMSVLEALETNQTDATPDSEAESVNKVDRPTLMQCYCCGKRGHMASQCYFHKYKCHNCGKTGHFKAVCVGNKKKGIDKQTRPKVDNASKSKVIT